jgi:hypothetical protein
MSNPWVAGEEVDDIKLMARVTTPINDVGSNWLTYVPTVTASPTPPTLGTGSNQLGQYIQIGKTVICDGFIQFGTSGTAAGTGNYIFSLPVAAAVPTPSTAFILGQCTLTSAGLSTRGDVYFNNSTTVTLRYTTAAVGGSLAVASSTLPGAWTTSDSMRIHVIYQAV